MDGGWLIGLTGFAFAMAATPGPNNTLATASAINYGVTRTFPFLGGIGFGVALITWSVTLVGLTLLSNPVVAAALKWAGVMYLLWLAWKIASAAPGLPGADTGGGSAKPFGFFQGAVIQLINPKLWIMVSGAVVAFGQPEPAMSAGGLSAVFAAILSGAT